MTNTTMHLIGWLEPAQQINEKQRKDSDALTILGKGMSASQS